MCKNLKGNICGSYGLIFAHNSNSQSICQERQTITFSNTEENDQIEIEYWHHHQTNSYQLLKDIQCYLWCSVTGQEPVIPQSNVDLPTNMSTQIIYDGLGISPHFIYTFNETQAASGKIYSMYS